MHNGSVATLDALIDFYDAGGDGTPDAQLAGDRDPLLVPLGLTNDEKADLRAFIEALDGADIPAALTTDTSN
jgi:cytochrome c peroxidase